MFDENNDEIISSISLQDLKLSTHKDIEEESVESSKAMT